MENPVLDSPPKNFYSFLCDIITYFQLSDQDYLVDLGCGHGTINITAAMVKDLHSVSDPYSSSPDPYSSNPDPDPAINLNPDPSNF